MELMKRSTLRWFDHIERMKDEKFVKKVHVSKTEDPNRRGRSLGRWMDRVKEYMCERGSSRSRGLELGRRERLDRSEGSSAVAAPLGGFSQRERGM